MLQIVEQTHEQKVAMYMKSPKKELIEMLIESNRLLLPVDSGIKQQSNFKVTPDQFEDLEHYKTMFERNADRIENLCNSEKDDIVYGFELGGMHSHLRDCFIEMMELLSEIKKN